MGDGNGVRAVGLGAIAAVPQSLVMDAMREHQAIVEERDRLRSENQTLRHDLFEATSKLELAGHTIVTYERRIAALETKRDDAVVAMAEQRNVLEMLASILARHYKQTAAGRPPQDVLDEDVD